MRRIVHAVARSARDVWAVLERHPGFAWFLGR